MSGYLISLRKKASKSQKKTKKSGSKPNVEALSSALEDLKKDPYSVSVPYTGNLSFLRKVTFGASPQYRIVFEVFNKEDILNDMENFADVLEEFGEGEFNKSDGIVEIKLLMTREDADDLYNKRKKELKSLKR